MEDFVKYSSESCRGHSTTVAATLPNQGRECSVSILRNLSYNLRPNLVHHLKCSIPYYFGFEFWSLGNCGWTFGGRRTKSLRAGTTTPTISGASALISAPTFALLLKFWLFNLGYLILALRKFNFGQIWEALLVFLILGNARCGWWHNEIWQIMGNSFRL